MYTKPYGVGHASTGSSEATSSAYINHGLHSADKTAGIDIPRGGGEILANASTLSLNETLKTKVEHPCSQHR